MINYQGIKNRIKINEELYGINRKDLITEIKNEQDFVKI